MESIQKALEPYIKSRDQVSYIRRVLALHLESGLESGSLQSPLSLVDTTCTLTAVRESRGLQREYLRALEANYNARREYEKIRRQNAASDHPATAARDASTDHVEDYVAAVRLQQKQEKLLVVQRYLDRLGQQPAAALDFMDPEAVFAESPRLPEVPSEVVQGFTVDTEATKTDLKALVSQLDKVVLRSKILLQREEQLLAEVKAKASGKLDGIGNGAKLEALNTTRTELITWIETELGKASPEGADSADDEPGGVVDARSRQKQPEISKKLAEIKDKYARYVESRRTLLDLAKQSPQPSLQPAIELAIPPAIQTSHPPGTTTYLLTPYLENLLVVSHEQKASILQKSHFNITLAKQMKETCQMLDRLADESQLLPDHAASSARAKFGGGLVDDLGLGASEKPDSSARVRAWVSAADAAKMATLEAVAGRLEEGQLALEGSMTALHEIDRLLGKTAAEEAAAADEEEEEEEDIWLAEAEPSKKGTASKKHASRRRPKAEKEKDLWSMLQGNIGLMGHDRSA